MGIPEGRKKGTKAMFEVTVTKNFSQINIRDQTTIQGAQRTPSRINTNEKIYTNKKSKMYGRLLIYYTSQIE